MDYQQHPDCHKQADYSISQDGVALRRKQQIPVSMKFLLAMAICLLSACSRPGVVRQLMNEVEQRNKQFMSLANDTALIPVVENLDRWSIFYPTLCSCVPITFWAVSIATVVKPQRLSCSFSRQSIWPTPPAAGAALRFCRVCTDRWLICSKDRPCTGMLYQKMSFPTDVLWNVRTPTWH